MTELIPIVSQVTAWRKRMAGDDRALPSILTARAYVRRRWPQLPHEEREAVLETVFETQRVAGAAILQFERQG